MADIIRIPGGVNITAGVGDVLTLMVTIKQNGSPVDISGWTIEASNAEATVIDGAQGMIQLVFSEDFPTLKQWFIRRAEPNARRLLAGYVQYVTTAGPSTSADVIEVTLEDAPDVTVEIVSAQPGPPGPPGPALPELKYGAFFCDQGQQIQTINTPQVVGMNGAFEADGVALVDNSKIVFDEPGAYTITWSLQFANSATQGPRTANVWHRLNGANIPLSNSRFDVPAAKSGEDGYLIGTVNFVKTMQSGDELELYWAGNSTTLKLATFAANGVINKPVTPCVILSAVQITRGA